MRISVSASFLQSHPCPAAILRDELARPKLSMPTCNALQQGGPVSHAPLTTIAKPSRAAFARLVPQPAADCVAPGRRSVVVHNLNQRQQLRIAKLAIFGRKPARARSAHRRKSFRSPESGPRQHSRSVSEAKSAFGRRHLK
jgi:hypothetical protein